MMSTLVHLLFLLFFTGLVVGLKLIEIRVDKYAIRGGSTLLECIFDLEGEALYSVKWYKDGAEFYRFTPRDNPPAQMFPVPGVHVKLEASNETQVMLRSLGLNSTGRYRCEVSGEAPSFQTVSDHREMLTIQLPEQGPRIDGGQPRYQVGDYVRLNCTSGPSKPAALLTWYINGVQANESLLIGPRIQSVGSYLEETALSLQFRVERQHFRNGDLKLKCLASIATVYWNSNEESVEGDRPQRPPVLEVKDNQPHISRADMVQVPSAAKQNIELYSYLTLILTLILLINFS